MTKISHYGLDSAVSKDDKVLGTDFEGSATKNFSVESLRDYFLEFVDGATKLSTTVTLTPAQMLSLNGGGAIELLPTPDTGKAYVLTDTFTKIEHNTTAYNFLYAPYFGYYDTETSNLAFYGYWGALERNILNDLYIGANLEDTFSRNITAATNPIIFRQMPIYLYSQPNNTVTQGDATVKIILEYRLIDLSL